jgi:CheY-like chemotaxis protein
MAKTLPRDAEARAAHTILVVDDEPAVRRVIAAALRRHGYRVVEAAEGASALGQLEQAHVDLVICDYLLSGGRVSSSSRASARVVRS